MRKTPEESYRLCSENELKQRYKDAYLDIALLTEKIQHQFIVREAIAKVLKSRGVNVVDLDDEYRFMGD